MYGKYLLCYILIALTLIEKCFLFLAFEGLHNNILLFLWQTQQKLFKENEGWGECEHSIIVTLLLTIHFAERSTSICCQLSRTIYLNEDLNPPPISIHILCSITYSLPAWRTMWEDPPTITQVLDSHLPAAQHDDQYLPKWPLPLPLVHIKTMKTSQSVKTCSYIRTYMVTKWLPLPYHYWVVT